MNVISSIHALEQYADSPDTSALKITKDGLVCVAKESLKGQEKMQHALHIGAFSNKEIKAFVNSKEFCTAVLWSKTKNVAKLDAVAKKFNFVNLQAVLDSKIGKLALTSFEKHLIAIMQPNLSQKEVLDSEIKAINALEIPSLRDANTVNAAKRSGLISACLQNKQPGMWVKHLDAIEAAYNAAEKLLPPLDAKNDRKIPNLAHQKMQKDLRDMVQRALDIYLDEMVKNPEAATTVVSRTREYIGACQKSQQSKYSFYEKWSSCLQEEMMQGFLNSDEILDMGVCYSLSIRWAVAELKHEETLSTEITAKDRFQQAFVEVMPDQHNDPDTKKVKKQHKIAHTHTYQWGKDVETKNLKGVLQQKLMSAEFKKHGGVGQFAFWYSDSSGPKGHTISVAFQPDRGHYRIADPTRGVFVLKDATEAVSCLNDLMCTFYNSKKFDTLRCYCFDLKS